MSYEKFTAYGAGSRDKCTLRASGYLFVPRGLCTAAGESSPTKVLLYFDETEQKLAIVPFEPLLEDDRDARDTSVEPSGVAIHLVPLLKVYGYAKPSKKILLDAVVIDFQEKKAIEIDMRGVPTARAPEAVSRW